MLYTKSTDASWASRMGEIDRSIMTDDHMLADKVYALPAAMILWKVKMFTRRFGGFHIFDKYI